MSQLAEQKENLIAPGHNACAGCGLILAARLVLNAAGPDVIVTNATGCLEVTTTNYPFSAWRVPWIHSLFENSAAVASGVEASLRAQGKLGKVKTYFPGFDELFNEGIPESSSVLVEGGPGSGRTPPATGVTQVPRGRPSTCMAMMPRMISEVPEAILAAGLIR